MATEVSICSNALILIGEEEITSLSEETREAQLCNALYGTTRDTLLQSHPWRFSLGQASLARLSATPEYDYKYAYQLPADMLRLIDVEANAIKWDIFENRIYTDATEVKVIYQFRPGPEKFPAYFVNALQLQMATALAVSLSEDESKSDLFERRANRATRMARNIDSQQRKAAVPDHAFSIIQVR